MARDTSDMKYTFFWDVGYDDYKKVQPKLEKNITADWLIVGGGLSGLHAALELVEQKKDGVVIVDSFECGRGTTGASTGFVMPDAETGLAELVSHFGKNGGEKLWNFVGDGCDLIWDTNKKYKLKTDLEQQDTVYIGLENHEKDIEEEYEALIEAGKTPHLHKQLEVAETVIGTGILNSVSYSKTYAMDPLLYAHQLKMYLISQGVTIYEHTTIEHALGHTAHTKSNTITFKKALITINKPRQAVSKLAQKIAGVQSSASVSRPLSRNEIESVFPDGKKYMVYDSKEFYLYWRLTADNRIILGQDSIKTLLNPKASQSVSPVIDAHNNFKKTFPQLGHIEFEYYWSEIIDGTYDLIPLLYQDGDITYSGGNVGLPWASRTGKETALVALGKDIDPILSETRVPLSMFGENPYLKIAQYTIYYGLAKAFKNKIS